ncbi:MAG: hypothetical protein MR208_02010 [Oscillospiraceae bacterium]|nr:hypothetical protein [Oscillospiraceae bacterium]MDD5920829.1 hypothetical protein [Oscillospiraceae bacterium]
MPAFGERFGKAGNKNGQFLKKVLPKAFDFQDFSLLKNGRTYRIIKKSSS